MQGSLSIPLGSLQGASPVAFSGMRVEPENGNADEIHLQYFKPVTSPPRPASSCQPSQLPTTDSYPHPHVLVLETHPASPASSSLSICPHITLTVPMHNGWAPWGLLSIKWTCPLPASSDERPWHWASINCPLNRTNLLVILENADAFH